MVTVTAVTLEHAKMATLIGNKVEIERISYRPLQPQGTAYTLFQVEVG